MAKKRKIKEKKDFGGAKLYISKLAGRHHDLSAKKAPYNTTKPLLAYYIITVTIIGLLAYASSLFPVVSAIEKDYKEIELHHQLKNNYHPDIKFISINYIKSLVTERIKPFHLDKDEVDSSFEEFSYIAEQPIDYDSPELFPEGDVIDTKPNPMIAIVIDDMGFTGYKTDGIIDLPAPLTLSFLPYVPKLKEKLTKSIAKGHEVIAHIPMEPTNPKYDAGPNALKTKMTAKEITKITKETIAKFSYITGANNHMGSKFTANEKGLRAFLTEFKKDGGYFLDSQTTAKSFGKQIATELQIPFIKRDVFLDNNPDKTKIIAQLRKLENIATKKGYAVGIGHPYKATIAALQEWIPMVKDNGFLIISTKEMVEYLEANKIKQAK